MNQNYSIELLYKQHNSWLVSWLRYKMNCTQNATDLAQDTFVRLLGMRELPDLQEPRAYLRVVAKGLAIDYFRRRSLEQAYLQALATLPEPESISPEDRESILEILSRIDLMLDKMPSKVRQVFLMSQLEGLKYSQIAVYVGISERTVKRYMQRGVCECLNILL